ncbi:Ribonuclease VapC1 [Pseudolycoriella hygida]|uniref:Ribonuclease VapC1 n=1 Tax=Pseudolycoriella hygida TaxID=35572 RepID=A0A9Q0N7G9_9DIPT|nr:Ribonuclease VapC1 [Pseudolycoriella hygida]
MPKVITVTDMVRSFSDIIGRVHYQGESFDIKKGANIVAKIMPVKPNNTIAVKDLNEFFSNGPHLDKDDIEEFGEDINVVKSLKLTDWGNKWDYPITVTELLIGVSRANTEERHMKRSVFVEHVINSITVLDFGVEEARVYNHILYNLFIENLTTGIHDMLIAASAIARGYPVLTLNGRDFKRIKGLEVLETSISD